jgi:hypothetical protein
MRSLALFLLTTLLTLTTAAVGATQETPLTETVIGGGDLPQPIRFAPVDADALTRRINDPPQLEAAPAHLGPAYSLSSPYWPIAAAEFESDDDETDQAVALPPVDQKATYYPEAGVARVTRGEESAWLALDRRQQAIIERYLRFGRLGVLSEDPGILRLLGVAIGSAEPITLAIGDRTISDGDLITIGNVADGLLATRLTPAQPPSLGNGDVWLVFTLPEGRTVQLLYDPEGATLTDYLGQERYDVTPLLAAALESFLAPPLAIAAPEDGGGSPLWWLLMLGGGAGALAGALWLRPKR